MQNQEAAHLLFDLMETKTRIEKLKAHKDARMKALTEDPAYMEVTRSLELQKEAQKEIQSELETLALKEYGEKGEKKLFGGAVGIRVRKVFKIVADKETLKAWCKENAPLVFEINEKKVKALAKNNDVPESIVKVTEVPGVTFASDLSKYLQEVTE